MIIIEQTAQSPLKPRDRQVLDVPTPGPPAYVEYVEYQPRPEYPIEPVHIEYRQSPARRFFEAFVVAVLIYFLCAMFTSSIVWNLDVGHHHRQRHQINWLNDNVNPSDPAERCVGGGDWSPYAPSVSSQYSQASRAAFDLPISSDGLYLMARGSLSYGNIKIEVLQDGGDKAIVDVIVHHHTPEALFRANICRLQRKSGENGIGIFTPQFSERYSREELLQFNITVYLPVRTSRLRINNFETDLPLFTHEVGDLARTVEFQHFSLKASNMPIVVKSLYADHASLQTSNGPITGSFNTSTSLELRTSNAPISTHIGLLNDPSKKSTELLLITSNAPLRSSISLLSTNSAGGSFNVTTRTSNNPLEIKYDTSPVDSILHHRAWTCNSPSAIDLHSAYEGTFSLQTSIFSPTVDSLDAVDPSGQGRKRSLEVFRAGRGNVLGEVYWGEEKQAGNIEVITSNSPAHLRL